MKQRLSPGIIALLLGFGILGACKSQSEQLRPTQDSHQRVQPAGPMAVAAPGTSVREATLFLMADIRGVLRPCGCTLELQKGGFDRLAPHIEMERKAYPSHRLLHAGPLFFGSGDVPKSKAAQWERQAEVLGDLLGKMRFDLTGGTAVDAIAAKGDYGKLIERSKVRVTAANLRVDGLGRFKRTLLERVGDVSIGIFALAAPHEGAAQAGVHVDDARKAASAAVAELRDNADVIVLLSALGLRKTKRLVRHVAGIDFAVVGGLGEDPVVSDEAELVGQTRVMQFHREGRWVGRLTLRIYGNERNFLDVSAPSKAEQKALDVRISQLTNALAGWAKKRKSDDPAVLSATHQLASLKTERDRLNQARPALPENKSTFSFRATALPWDLPQDPDILTVMDAFDAELKAINLKHAPTLPEAKPGEAVYIGVAKCLDCHDETESYWKHDRHALAWETLEKGNKTFDAECVSCHVTGYGKAGGSIIGKTAGLEDVQCESCHGPGSLHAEAEEGKEKETILLRPTEETCLGCHNKHHSPHFDFRKYREKLLVPGHGKPAP